MSSCPYSSIPGKPKLPFVGDTLDFIFQEPVDFVDSRRNKYGDVFKVKTFGNDVVVIIKPNTTKRILIDHSKDFNSRESWETALKDLFPNGLMLMDGERHKLHRGVISEVFKKEPMDGYLKMMIPISDQFLDRLDNGVHKMFPLFKEFTLKIALSVFFGLNPENEISDINKAITNIVKAAASLHVNLPFTTYGKGIAARKYLVSFFTNLIDQKRENPGNDLFSKLCLSKSESGDAFSDEQVVDHLIFILMAAHDTTASTLTSLCYFLAKREEWQSDLREEVNNALSSNPITQKLLKQLEKTNLAVKETLRIYPPLTSVSRVSNKDLTFESMTFPSGTFFSIPISYFQLDKDIWQNPEEWDPQRFSKERREDKKYPYAYSPFGAGLHHCIGYAFAEMQINLVIAKILQKFELSVPEDYKMPMKAIPLQEPKDGLPMRLTKR